MSFYRVGYMNGHQLEMNQAKQQTDDHSPSQGKNGWLKNLFSVHDKDR